MMEKKKGIITQEEHGSSFKRQRAGNQRDKTTPTLTRLEVHHLGDKAIVCDGELGELQFVQAVDVPLAL